ncbi:MAG: manganese efflux pump [Bacteroidales bacterium]|nr:manganese efflux pump [Bacteroidales bacterium]
MFIESILLALALCVDSLVVSTTSSFRSKMTLRRGVLMAAIFALFQGGFPFLGALLGIAFKGPLEAIDHWVAFFLLLFVGGKMIIDVLRDKPEEEQMDLSKIRVLCLLGVATSIDAFVVGIGLGLDNSLASIVLTVITIGIVTFIVSLVGWFLGSRNIPVPERIATILAGLVLIGLGTYTLIEHLTL